MSECARGEVTALQMATPGAIDGTGRWPSRTVASARVSTSTKAVPSATAPAATAIGSPGRACGPRATTTDDLLLVRVAKEGKAVLGDLEDLEPADLERPATRSDADERADERQLLESQAARSHGIVRRVVSPS